MNSELKRYVKRYVKHVEKSYEMLRVVESMFIIAVEEALNPPSRVSRGQMRKRRNARESLRYSCWFHIFVCSNACKSSIGVCNLLVSKQCRRLYYSLIVA